MTPATTGRTNAVAAAATLRCGRNGTMAAPSATARTMPVIAPHRPLRTPRVSHRIGPPIPGGKLCSQIIDTYGTLFTTCSRPRPDTRPMADLLAVLGILGFVLVSLGLIWALDRV